MVMCESQVQGERTLRTTQRMHRALRNDKIMMTRAGRLKRVCMCMDLLCIGNNVCEL